MSDLLLSYSFLTKPGVLQAGNLGRLTIIVSNAKAPFTLTGIDFVLTEGTGARDITNSVTPTTPSLPDGWSHPAPTGGKFSMSPAVPYQIGRDGLIFVFDLTVSTMVGTAMIAITEHIEVNGAPQANRGSLAIPKFPQSFQLDNFYSATPIINQGDSVTLVWTGQNLHLANYRISYSVNGQTTVVNIPAHTFIYTVDAVDASSVFYLHVSAEEDPDTSFIFQSSVYPITVNPAIAEFWAEESVAAPGSSVLLNWRVSDTVSSATITCPQSGTTWSLDAAALGKRQLAITLPAISMLAQYVFQTFNSGQSGTPPVMVASKTLSIAVSANIPFLQSGYAQFVTDAQAQDLAQMPSRPFDDTVVPQLIDEIFSAFKVAFPDIDFYLDWSNQTPNTRSFVYIDGRKKVVIHGGLIRISCLYYEAFCFIIAQCVARLLGQAPVDHNGLTYIGVADHYATSTLLTRVFFSISDDSDLLNGIEAQIKTLFQTGISTQNRTADPDNLAANPGIPCRYSAINAGIFGHDVPTCVTGST
ncbi:MULTISPECIES: hypothetical protein [Burkholderiaceae]|uniref:hypothetical protein n=1 Tax=Burkholderiaceae TaxID=119060 RepID=UPI00095F5FDE|nr:MULTISPECIES: hypothetical protein [Burkholderiaceae]MCF2133792.1 hypothetical protein [Mycetohabitans sp. B3]MCG1038842.1 hypothetical protein [Mycetohabitans sp. B7]SIT68551.1 hypothetical protein SAMN04487769_1343 [Burkholderia sp. b14]